MKILKSLFVMLLGLACWQVTYAEGNCPSGYFPVGGNGPGQVQGCIPMQGADQESAEPTERWESRWGAIATDEPHGILGSSTGMRSRSQAMMAAMQDCARQGASHCKFELAFDNECAVLVASDQDYVVVADQTIDLASRLAMKTCQDGGNKNCDVHFSTCSLPALVR